MENDYKDRLRITCGLDTEKLNPVFKTDRDVREFRESLERATEEKFKEYERNRRASWHEAKYFWLD